MPRRNKIQVKTTVWNLGKPGGWKDYKELTNKAAVDIEDIIANGDTDINEVIKKVENIENGIKFQAVGKT